MDVLLGHDVSIPRRHAARAVVQCAQHLAPARIGLRLQTCMAGCRPGQLHPGIRGDASVEPTVEHDAPLAVHFLDLDD